MCIYFDMLLLLSYHICLRMISEALDLRVEGGRVSNSWCMDVVSHGYGGLGQGWRWWTVFMQDKARGLVACREMPELFLLAR